MLTEARCKHIWKTTRNSLEDAVPDTEDWRNVIVVRDSIVPHMRAPAAGHVNVHSTCDIKRCRYLQLLALGEEDSYRPSCGAYVKIDDKAAAVINKILAFYINEDNANDLCRLIINNIPENGWVGLSAWKRVDLARAGGWKTRVQFNNIKLDSGGTVLLVMFDLLRITPGNVTTTAVALKVTKLKVSAKAKSSVKSKLRRIASKKKVLTRTLLQPPPPPHRPDTPWPLSKPELNIPIPQTRSRLSRTWMLVQRQGTSRGLRLAVAQAASRPSGSAHLTSARFASSKSPPL